MTKVCSEAFYFVLCQTPILNTDMQIVVLMIYNSVLYVLVGSPLIGDVILVHCVQINVKGEGSFLFCILCGLATG